MTGKMRQLRSQRGSIELGDLVKVLGAGIVAFFALRGCKESVDIYTDVADCQRDYPDCPAQCEAAYQRIMAEAQREAPRYADIGECNSDFGEQCAVSDDHSARATAVAFMLPQSLDCTDGDWHYRGRGLFTSGHSLSPAYNRLVTASGANIAPRGADEARVDPAELRSGGSSPLLRRGGFGDTMRRFAARSSS